MQGFVTAAGEGIYDRELDKNTANYSQMTPLSFIERAAFVYPGRTAVVYGEVRRNWAQTYDRVRRLASALSARGIGKGDTVAVIAANIPEMFELHFAVPMVGAVLNAINTRLDAEAIGFILNHGEARMLIVDPEFSDVAERAVHIAGRPIEMIDILDPEFEGGHRVGASTYDDLLEEGTPDFRWERPADEWDAISLNYTSGTTGDPKGVVYHHRGAYLNAIGNILTWNMANHPVYLWTLPMFHCNGWCFPWTIAAAAGISVCLRAVRVEPIYDLIKREKVTHFCGAPIVLNLLAHAPDDVKAGIEHKVSVMTAGAAPPAAVIESMEAMGFDVTHAYGLTETYGPAVVCAWHDEWNDLDISEKARLKARQGVRYSVLDGLMVADPETLEPVPSDGETMGEIFFRGNNVMRGYLKNPSSSAKAFAGGWFHSGDLAVCHADGYIEIKDRSKDIIISGGENISSIEVEGVLYRHPAVMEAAIVARPDEKWGETPCAFVGLKPGSTVTEQELITFCRANMAHFKAPKTVVFGPLPKTSTGKIQKYVLREKAKAL
ncbi:acyl-CoA synthetase [Rhizobium sp. S-51]|uniref:3-methylmercaptopropionyl-CoA ligase n=1 Tax=Rhizobium terricola TaxID=2728849 RepID=A0A7Y0ASM9_9HYPH|nr:acyl-CoA synthetase [Rhizobium terricola]NML72774.1 acyl-CoA synthetase [Rhizobium terricola]